MDEDPWTLEEYISFKTYDAKKFESGPTLSEACSLSKDAISLYHSFGYDCSRRNNLAALDDHTLAFVSGTYLQFLDPVVGSTASNRSALGTGISCFTVHPQENVFVVAEKGDTPPIIFYTWPKLEILSVLNGITESEYACLAFSGCGTYIAVQGSEPDLTFSIWNWKEGVELARSHAHHGSNFQIKFSDTDFRHLAVCGEGHLTFWKLEDTPVTAHDSNNDEKVLPKRLFMDQGSFVSVDSANIESIILYGTSGKIISSTHWGNLLLWKDRFVQVEICRKDGSKCHEGSINHLVVGEGELVSIGSDGMIRVWDLGSIYDSDMELDIGDSCCNPGQFHVDPMYEIEVESGANLQSIVKGKFPNEDQNHWFVQDARGSIWRVDLSFSLSMQKPTRIFKCHASQVMAVGGSSFNSLLMSGGSDGKCCIYDLNRKTMVDSVQYSSGVSSVTWLPIELDPSGKQVLIGYDDGVIRLFLVETENEPRKGGNLYRVTKALSVRFQLIIAKKPHKGRVLKSCVSKNHPVVCTVGEDRTLFFLKYFMSPRDHCVDLIPIKFIATQDVPMTFEWNEKLRNAYHGILILRNGLVYHFYGDEPYLTSHSSDVTSFEDPNPPMKKIHDFQPKQQEPSGTFSISIIYAQSLPSSNFLLIFCQISQYQQELHIYQCEANESGGTEALKGLKKFLVLPRMKENILRQDSLEASITSVTLWLNDQFLFLGYDDGVFRVYNLGQSDPMAWNLDNFWTLSLFEPTNGRINGIFPMEFAQGHVLAICADDGGLMVMRLESEFNEAIDAMKRQEKIKLSQRNPQEKLRISWGEAALTSGISDEKVVSTKKIQDLDDPNHPSLEQERLQDFQDSKSRSIEEKKIFIQRNLANLKNQFKGLLVRNEQLPDQFQFPLSEFQLTDFTYKEIEAENQHVLDQIRQHSLIEQEGNERILQRIKTAFLDDIAQPRRIVKGIRDNIELKSFRIVKDDNISLDSDVFSRLNDRSKGKMDSRSTTLTTEDYQPSSASSSTSDEMDGDNDSEVELNSEEQALIQCSNSPTQSMVSMNAFNTLKQPLDRKLLDGRILKALQRQEERQNKKKTRLKQWEELLARKPLDDPDNPYPVQEIKEAHPNLGQFIRKTSPLYEDEHPVKEDAQRKRIVTLLMKIREIKENFNARVAKIKERKSKLIQELEDLRKELIEIQEKLVPKRRQPYPQVPQLQHEEIERDLFQIDEAEILSIKDELVRDEESKIEEGVQSSTTSSKGGSKPKLERRGSMLPLGGIGAISSAKSLAKLVSEKEVRMSDLTEIAQNSFREEEEDGEDEENCQDLSWNMSKEEEEIQYILEQRWVFHQDQLIAKMNSLIDRFDEELQELISSKKKIDVQVKYAEIVAISMYEELQIISSCEKEENALLENVEKIQNALDMNATKIKSKELELDQIKQNLEKYMELLKQIYEKVTYELSDNRHVEHLTKLFHVKGKHLKLPKDKDERYLCPNSNEEVEMIKPDLFREESITEDQTHPHNLDPKALEFVLDMRRRRDLVESAIRSQEKVLKKMETNLSRLQSRQNYKNTMFQDGKSALHAFRTRKQSQINQLKVVVGLRKSQLILPQEEYDQANLPSSALVVSRGSADQPHHHHHPCGNPDEKNDALLVYPWQHWQQLQTKSEELKLERSSFKKKFKEEKQEYVNLQEECKSLTQQIQLLETQCSVEMAKRFGSGISMEDIEEFSTNRTLEEMREGAKRQEEQRYREIELKQEQIKRDKQALTEAIRNNTKLVEKKTQLLRERTKLESLKVSNEQTLSKELKMEPKEAEASEEIKDLLKLYHSQQNELGEMHHKLAQFMTKGIHVSRIPLSPPDKETKKKIIATAKVKLNRQGSSTSSCEETDQDHDLWDSNQGSPGSVVSIVVEKVE